jgi:hypothetical protein
LYYETSENGKYLFFSRNGFVLASDYFIDRIKGIYKCLHVNAAFQDKKIKDVFDILNVKSEYDLIYVEEESLSSDLSNSLQIQFEELNIKKGGNILNELFEKYLGDDVIIPYDMDARKKKFWKAFEELKDYMYERL